MATPQHDACLLGQFSSIRFETVTPVTGWTLFGSAERHDNSIVRPVYAGNQTADGGAESTADLLHTDEAWLVTGEVTPEVNGSSLALFGIGEATGALPSTSNPSMQLMHVHRGAGFEVFSYQAGGSLITNASAFAAAMLVGVGMFTAQTAGGPSKRMFAFRETEPGSQKLRQLDVYPTAVAAAKRIKCLMSRQAHVFNIQHYRLTADRSL